MIPINRGSETFRLYEKNALLSDHKLVGDVRQ